MKYSVQQIEQALRDGRSIQFVTSRNEQFSCRFNRCTNQVVFSVGHLSCSTNGLKYLLEYFELNTWVCTNIEGEQTMENKTTPHKHAELIKKWADGAIIQYRNVITGVWVSCGQSKPAWDEQVEYRVKPTKVTKFRWVFESALGDLFVSDDHYSELEAYKRFFNVIQKIESTMIEVEE